MQVRSATRRKDLHDHVFGTGLRSCLLDEVAAYRIRAGTRERLGLARQDGNDLPTAHTVERPPALPESGSKTYLYPPTMLWVEGIRWRGAVELGTAYGRSLSLYGSSLADSFIWASSSWALRFQRSRPPPVRSWIHSS